MLKLLLPWLVAVTLWAEAPRPRPGFEGLELRLTGLTAAGSGAPRDRSAGLELVGDFALTQRQDWRYGWGFRLAEVRHDWAAAPLEFSFVRSCSLNLSGHAATSAGRTRYAVLQLNAAAGTGAPLGGALTAQALYGADWKVAEAWTLGYLFLAETRAVRDPLVLVVPTFRWRFAPDWSVGTGRKSLVLDRRLDDAWRASLTLAFLQEEARLADVGGLAQSYEAERVALLAGLRRSAPQRTDEFTVGWAFRARARWALGGGETTSDLAPGVVFSYASRWRF